MSLSLTQFVGRVLAKSVRGQECAMGVFQVVWLWDQGRPRVIKAIATAVSVLFTALGVCVIGVAARGLIKQREPARDRVAIAATAQQIRAREHPLHIDPVGGLDGVVTEDQAIEALCASLPMWNPPAVPQLLHELMLWGLGASFPPEILSKPWSGVEAAEILLSDKLCRERTAPYGGSYLLDSPFGIRVVPNKSADALGTGAVSVMRTFAGVFCG
jgi:hypothetical protein